MANFNFPICRQQKQFEDICKSLIKIASELQMEQLEDLHEYALQLFGERFDNIHIPWNERNK